MIVFNGCSFTQYFWPSWADMLCYGYDNRINLANMGSGNEYIFLTTYPYMEKADKMCIQWSGYSRFDYCKDGKWNIDGNITLNHMGNWDRAKWFYDDNHFQQKDAILRKSFNDLTKYHNIQTHYMDLEIMKKEVKDRTYTFETTPNPFAKKKNFKDGHPDVYMHFEYACDVSDNLGIDFNRNEVEDKLELIHTTIHQIKSLGDIWNNPITL